MKRYKITHRLSALFLAFVMLFTCVDFNTNSLLITANAADGDQLYISVNGNEAECFDSISDVLLKYERVDSIEIISGNFRSEDWDAFNGENSAKIKSSLKSFILSENVNVNEQLSLTATFEGYTELKVAIIPHVKILQTKVFMGCKNLVIVKLPDTEKVLDASFKDCVSLKSIILENVTQVGSEAFKNCTNLEKVFLPYWGKERPGLGWNDSNMEYEAFYNCESLKYMEVHSLPPNMTDAANGLFVNCPERYLKVLSGNTEPFANFGGDDDKTGNYSAGIYGGNYQESGYTGDNTSWNGWNFGADDGPDGMLYTLGDETKRVLSNGTSVPLSNVEIKIEGTTQKGKLYSDFDVSDNQGKYYLYGVPLGSYEVKATDYRNNETVILKVDVDKNKVSVKDENNHNNGKDGPLEVDFIFRDTVVTPTTGSVSGAVKSDTGMLIQEADLTVKSGDTLVTTGQSGNDGSYNFGNLEPGTYTITASKDGFSTETITVTITAGNDLTGKDIILKTHYDIKGTVFDEKSTDTNRIPIENATVVLKESVQGTETNMTTDEYGEFKFDDLIAGTYAITNAYADYYYFDSELEKNKEQNLNSIVIPNSIGSNDKDIYLSRWQTVFNITVSPTDAKVTIKLKGTSGEKELPVNCNNGVCTASIDSIESKDYQSYTYTVEKENYDSFTPEQDFVLPSIETNTNTTINLGEVLLPVTKYVLSGKVTYNDHPENGIKVVIKDINTGNQYEPIITDSDGNFRIVLSAGEYTIATLETDCFNSYYGTEEISLKSNTTHDIKLVSKTKKINVKYFVDGVDVSDQVTGTKEKTYNLADFRNSKTEEMIIKTTEVPAYFNNVNTTKTITSNQVFSTDDLTINITLEPVKTSFIYKGTNVYDSISIYKPSASITPVLIGEIGENNQCDRLTKISNTDILQTGDYEVVFKKDGYAPVTKKVSVNEIHKNTNTDVYFDDSDINWEDYKYYTIKGTVKDEAGNLINGATVTLSDGSTDETENGEYSFTNIVPGDYTIHAEADYYTIDPTKDTDKDITVTEANFDVDKNEVTVNKTLTRLETIFNFNINVAETNIDVLLKNTTFKDSLLCEKTTCTIKFDSVVVKEANGYNYTVSKTGYVTRNDDNGDKPFSIDRYTDTVVDIKITDFELQTFNISGKVIDKYTGNPITGAIVKLDYDESIVSGPTLDDGVWNFENVEYGPHSLHAHADYYNPNTIYPDEDVLVDGETNEYIIRLTPFETIFTFEKNIHGFDKVIVKDFSNLNVANTDVSKYSTLVEEKTYEVVFKKMDPVTGKKYQDQIVYITLTKNKDNDNENTIEIKKNDDTLINLDNYVQEPVLCGTGYVLVKDKVGNILEVPVVLKKDGEIFQKDNAVIGEGGSTVFSNLDDGKYTIWVGDKEIKDQYIDIVNGKDDYEIVIIDTSGLVNGFVLDKDDYSGILDAKVTIVNTDKNTYTDINGKFSFTDVLKDTYTFNAIADYYLPNSIVATNKDNITKLAPICLEKAIITFIFNLSEENAKVTVYAGNKQLSAICDGKTCIAEIDSKDLGQINEFRYKVEKEGFDTVENTVNEKVLINKHSNTEFKVSVNLDKSQYTVTGKVIDSITNDAIENAEVIIGTDYKATTDADGLFNIPNILHGTKGISSKADYYFVNADADKEITGNENIEVALIPVKTKIYYDNQDQTVYVFKNKLLVGKIENGLFEAYSKDLSDGNYELYITQTGYQSQKVNFELTRNLYDDTEIKNIQRVELIKTAKITVEVRDNSTDHNIITPVDVTILKDDQYIWGKLDMNSGITTFKDLNDGIYTIVVNVDGKEYFDEVVITNGTDVHKVINVETYLKKLYGTVTDIDTQLPIENAKVVVFSHVTGRRFEVFTDDKGYYSIEDIPQGNYFISITKNYYSNVLDKLVIEPDESYQYDAKLSKRIVRGHVVDEITGESIAEAVIYDEDGEVLTYTDARGLFIVAIKDETDIIIGTKTGYNTVEIEVTTGETTVLIKLREERKLTGNVIDGKTKEVIPDAKVILYKGLTPLFETTTDANGNYTFDNLSAYNYQVRIIKDYYDIKKYDAYVTTDDKKVNLVHELERLTTTVKVNVLNPNIADIDLTFNKEIRQCKDTKSCSVTFDTMDILNDAVYNYKVSAKPKYRDKEGSGRVTEFLTDLNTEINIDVELDLSEFTLQGKLTANDAISLGNREVILTQNDKVIDKVLTDDKGNYVFENVEYGDGYKLEVKESESYYGNTLGVFEVKEDTVKDLNVASKIRKIIFRYYDEEMKDVTDKVNGIKEMNIELAGVKDTFKYFVFVSESKTLEYYKEVHEDVIIPREEIFKDVNTPIVYKIKLTPVQTIFQLINTRFDRYDKVSVSKEINGEMVVIGNLVENRQIKLSKTLTDGNYIVTYEKEGYKTLVKDDLSVKRNVYTDTYVDVPLVKLEEDRTVTGIVTDEDGKPIEGAEITDENGNKLGESDEDGKFVVELPKDSETIIIDGDGYKPEEVPVKPGDNVTVELEENDRIISGKVTDDKGNPVKNATVTDGKTTVITDENGNYTITVDKDATKLTAEKDGYETTVVLITDTDKVNIILKKKAFTDVQTDDTTNENGLLFTLVMSGLALLLTFFKRKESEE